MHQAGAAVLRGLPMSLIQAVVTLGIFLQPATVSPMGALHKFCDELFAVRLAKLVGQCSLPQHCFHGLRIFAELFQRVIRGVGQLF